MGLTVVLLSLAGVTALAWLAYSRTVRSIHDDVRRTYAAVTESEDPCRAGTEAVLRRWSELGWSRSCVRDGLPDGPWEAWSGEVIVIRGFYTEGLRTGRWVWCSRDGDVTRILEYDPAGAVIRDSKRELSPFAPAPEESQDSSCSQAR